MADASADPPTPAAADDTPQAKRQKMADAVNALKGKKGKGKGDSQKGKNKDGDKPKGKGKDKGKSSTLMPWPCFPLRSISWG